MTGLLSAWLFLAISLPQANTMKPTLIIVSALKTIPGQMPLLHLRRFAKHDFVPEHLRFATKPGWKWRGHASTDPAPLSIPLPSSSTNVSLAPSSASLSDPSPQEAIPQKNPGDKDEELVLKSAPQETMHTLLCPTEIISATELDKLIRTALAYPNAPLNIIAIPVPRYPPISLEMAEEKSQRYWPTVYMNGNPFGPHPTAVQRAASEVEGDNGQEVAALMALARSVGKDAARRGDGDEVGVVVVERPKDANGKANGPGKVIAVAGDGR